MNRILIIISALVVSSSCSNENSIESEGEIETVYVNQDSINQVLRVDSILESNLSALGFVNLKKVDSAIRIDLRYATDNNFMKTILYDSLRTIYLRSDVATRLASCQRLLDSIKPGHFLLVYDGVRPLDVQKEMWEALDSIPASERGKFVSNPLFGSVHNYGAAVDLTICDVDGVVLDMGAGYDDFRDIAFPSLESKHLKSGELTREQYENRKLLRKVMRSERFFNIPSEWWHFNAYSRRYCDSLFEALQFESGN